MNDKRKFGRYEIIAPLGSGGMAEVFKAYDPLRDRHVALKTLKSDWRGDNELIGRLLREGRAAGALNHPNIVVIYNLGTDPAPFIDMELVEGPSLAKLIEQKGRLSAAQTVEIICPIAEALDYAHQQGRIHRDIKPSNILLTSDLRTPKLSDFGIAMIDRPEATQLTQHGQILGTPRYMSPEQIRGGRVDSRSDMFSLGATMYEMATGKRAFPGDSLVSVTMQVVSERPRPVRELAPDVPPPVAAAIERLLEKDPNRRFQSGAELIEALEAWSALSPPVPRRRRWIVVATMVVIPLVVVGSWGLKVLYDDLTKDITPPLTVDDTAKTRAGELVTIAVLGNDSDPESDQLRLVGAELKEGPPGTVEIKDNLLVYDPGSAFAELPEGETVRVPIIYRVRNDTGLEAEGRVVVIVQGMPHPPVAYDDVASTDTSVPVTIDVLANDSDPDGAPLTVFDARVLTPGAGVVRIEDDRLVYDPGERPKLRPHETEQISLAYRIRDPDGLEAEGHVEITLWGRGKEEPAPIPPDHGSTDAGEPIPPLPAPEGLRAALFQLQTEVIPMACARVEADLADEPLRIIGYAENAEDRVEIEARARELLTPIATNGLDVRVESIPTTFPACHLFDLLSATTLPKPGRLLRLVPPLDGACANARDSCYRSIDEDRLLAGEHLVLEATAPSDFTSHVTVDYFMADGNVAHLAPQPDVNGEEVAADSYRNSYEPGSDFWIGDKREGILYRDYSVQSPFGKEMVLLIAAHQPLFAESRSAVEQTSAYLESLSAALNRAAHDDKRPIASTLIIETAAGRR